MDDFEWDPRKAHVNLKKHGVTFTDAASALEDEYALTMEDDDPDEQRFITLGVDALGRILIVVYTYRSTAIRIISARNATPRERQYYEEGRR